MNGPVRIGRLLTLASHQPVLHFPLPLTEVEKRAGWRREQSQRSWIIRDMEKRRGRKKGAA